MKHQSHLVVNEPMDNLSGNWDWDHMGLPQQNISDRIVQNSIIGLIAPPCGKTICDVPDIVKSYDNSWEFRQMKTLRYI